MIRLKYNDNKQPTIYVLATPIGNLKEINQRFIETINKLDVLLCEDTRITQKLLNHLNIKDKKLISFHKHNEYEKNDLALDLLNEYHEIGIISDAGYPLISDPGQTLINNAVNKEINVVVINGANALLPALICSGFVTTPFTFIGFLNKKSSEAKLELVQYQNIKHTLILYETVPRLNKTLKLIYETFGDIKISISREITKLNEEHIYGNVSELLLANLELKGELVLCLNNEEKANKKDIFTDDVIIKEVALLIEDNVSKKNAIKEVSKKLGIEKNYVYDLVHKKK